MASCEWSQNCGGGGDYDDDSDDDNVDDNDNNEMYIFHNNTPQFFVITIVTGKVCIVFPVFMERIVHREGI